jgi:L-ascorbate metabolism protein UlaG (beta-lactamase superfamily)
MREQHVDPDEAVQIMEDLGAVRAVGIHWGIFQLTDEAWSEPSKLLLNALRRRGISPHLFPAGEPGLQYEATSMSDRRPRDHVHGGCLWSRLVMESNRETPG